MIYRSCHAPIMNRVHPSATPNEDHNGFPNCRAAAPGNASGPVVTALVPGGVTEVGLGVMLSGGSSVLGDSLTMADGVDGVSDVTGGGGEVEEIAGGVVSLVG